MRVVHHHPQWVRSCRDCARWVMNDRGEFETFGDPPQRIPLPGPPPCWQCPKQPDGLAADAKHPLPPGADFGPWFEDLVLWYRECREVGYPPDLSPLLREAAAVLGTAEREAERTESRRILLELARRR